MADKNLKFDLQIATKGAQKELKETATAAEGLSTELTNVATKGQVVADAMRAMADQTEQELDESQAAVDALGNALGVEFKGKVEAAGGSVDKMVGNLRDAGLSFDDIKADADQLADAIKRVDQAGSRLDSVKGGADRLGKSLNQTNQYGSQTRSVMANMMGNTAQDMGAVLGVTGSLGVGIGQMAEYASEGGISLKGMAVGGAGLAAVGVAMGMLADRAKAAAAVKLWETDRIKAYTEAVREGKTEVQAITDILRSTEEIRGGLGPLAVDLVPIMAELGLTVDDFAKLVAGSDEQLAQFEATMRAAGAGGLDFENLMAGVRDEQERLREGTLNAADAMAVYGEKTDVARDSVLKANDQQREYERTLRDVNAAYDDTHAATETQIAANDRHYQKLGEVDAKYDDVVGVLPTVRDREDELADAMQRVNDKIDAQNEKWDLLTGELDDEQAFLDLATQFDNMGQAHVDATAAVESGAKTQEQAMRDVASEVITTKSKVADYAREVLGLPPERVTKFLAMIDAGQAAEVEQRLAILARNRTMQISIETRGGVPFGTGPRAAGGPVGMNEIREVNEVGPEVFTVGGRSYLMTGSQGGVVTPNHAISASTSNVPLVGVLNYTAKTEATVAELSRAMHMARLAS